MADKYLRRGAIIDTIKSEQRTNAIQKRKGTPCNSRERYNPLP